MAIRLQDKQNTAAPDTDYEYGRIKDDAGSGDGTPVDVQVYGDFHQFFARLMGLAGNNYNGLPDNTTNGYQYIEAMEKLTGFGAWNTIPSGTLVSMITYNTGSSTLFGSSQMKWKLQGRLFLCELRLQFNTITGSPTEIYIPFPSGIAPANLSAGVYYFFTRGSYRPNGGNPEGIDVLVEHNRFTYKRGTAFSGPATISFTAQFEITV